MNGMNVQNFSLFNFKKILFIYFQREGEKHDVWEKHQLVASHMPPTGNQAHNPGMCPHWESNWQPFTLQDNVQLSHTRQGCLQLFNGTLWEEGQIYLMVQEKNQWMGNKQIRVGMKNVQMPGKDQI